jgi:hypothetical protein
VTTKNRGQAFLLVVVGPDAIFDITSIPLLVVRPKRRDLDEAGMDAYGSKNLVGESSRTPRWGDRR